MYVINSHEVNKLNSCRACTSWKMLKLWCTHEPKAFYRWWRVIIIYNTVRWWPIYPFKKPYGSGTSTSLAIGRKHVQNKYARNHGVPIVFDVSSAYMGYCKRWSSCFRIKNIKKKNNRLHKSRRWKCSHYIVFFKRTK